MNYLAQLPVKVLRAKIIGKDEFVPILVDGDYDGEYLAEYNWRVLESGYVIVQDYKSNINERTGEYIPRGGKTIDMMYLHHWVLPKKKGFWVRHINGNKLDNRSCNLEYITPQESALTRKQGKNHTDRKYKYRGVRRAGDGRGWISKSKWTVYCNKKYRGTYIGEENAARAYDKYAKEEFGDKAILNFPEERDNG